MIKTDDLRSIFVKWDPMGLIAIGCPEFEYDREILMLIMAFKNDMTANQVGKLIYKIFVKEIGIRPTDFKNDIIKHQDVIYLILSNDKHTLANAGTRYTLAESLDGEFKGPYRFREPGGTFEGEVDTIPEIINKFEPIDVLDGRTELVDATNRVYVIFSTNTGYKHTNTYPQNYNDLYIMELNNS